MQNKFLLKDFNKREDVNGNKTSENELLKKNRILI
jgi:hypothetical protein